jgi:arylsulfatase A-like enzyme
MNTAKGQTMKRTLTFSFLLLAPLAALHAADNPDPKPNIILILADDLGYGDLGCYGSEINDTPHIDALAKGGLRFTDYHSAGAMCSPTRASILTGRYPQRFGRMFDGALSGTTQRDLGLPLEATTIAELLRKNGYATGCFGKWHLGYQAPLLPTRQGFDIFRGLVSGDGDFHTHIDRSGNKDWWHNDRIEMAEGYTTDLLTKYSINFIESHREEPFFLYLPHLAIHFPWQGSDDPPHRTAGKSWHTDKWGVIPDRGNVAPHVKAMIESLDASVGAIVAALRKWDIKKDTLVIFTSDNGGYLTYGKDFRHISSNGPWRGQKTQVYEGGHRVPMIVSWRGRIPPGVTDAITHSNDLFPTLLGLSGADPVESDGINLAPQLIERRSLPERDVFWRTMSHRAVRTGPWKLVMPLRAGAKPELYNLDDDPGEQRNVAKEKPAIAKKLSATWSQWESDVNLSAREYSR